MTSGQIDAKEPVRLFFEMTRDDNPRLYDNLIRFNKGTKRVNRLRFLAHERLMAQQWLAAQSGAMAAPRSESGSSVNSSIARHTNHDLLTQAHHGSRRQSASRIMAMGSRQGTPEPGECAGRAPFLAATSSCQVHPGDPHPLRWHRRASAYPTTCGFLQCVNGRFQAAQRRERGCGSLDTIKKTVVFLSAGTLDFKAIVFSLGNPL